MPRYARVNRYVELRGQKLAPAAAGARPLHILDKSTFGQAHHVTAGHDAVIEDPDFDQGQRFFL